MSRQSSAKAIRGLFNAHRNESIKTQMEAYMKHHFVFYGVKSPERKKLVSEYWSDNKQIPDESFKALILSLWSLPERENKYFAMDIMLKVMKKMDESWLDIVEELILDESWWDTVDILASNIVGTLFRNYPHLIETYTGKWMSSGNMWLQRTCLLFQLKYKTDTDFAKLSFFIIELKGGDEFFINKAIGWSLRQYSKFEPVIVRQFIHDNPDLSKLSIKEASKYL